ncbi:MAG: hypothetical protein H0V17_16055 [Deltaproteobacteria bacterium]|nr:hypothetical protein [Deltaproteobacteria bacterium]
MPRYGSIDDAKRAFEAYVRIEPQLEPLWALCEHAAPPVRGREVADADDAYDVDAFDIDVVADQPDDGWCTEDYFQEHVKAKLVLLVGAYRSGAAPELHSTEAYDAIYDLLINWALDRTCTCCAEQWQRVDANPAAYA